MTSPQQTFSVSKKPQKRILSGMFVALCGLFLAGCPYDNINFHALKLQNSYFKTLYIVENGTSIEIPINEIRGVFLKEKDISSYKVNFYQDKTLACYLFSLDNLDSKELNSTIFVIDKDGIHSVNNQEFIKRRSPRQPHPYDASLCRPAPKTERKQI